jgi:two-component system, OmpR family, KDP operon response regulator KdpE
VKPQLFIKSPKKQTVLVVDDQPQVLKFVAIDLKLHGFNVITVCSGEEAMEQIEQALPDIMLLDIIMPGMDGFEVLRRVRSFSQMPVITFSASSSNYTEAIRLGANDFINKPFQPDDMIKRIKALLDDGHTPAS